jgi:hypothetical protein
MIKEIQFNKERVATLAHFSKLLLSEPKITATEDFVHDELVLKLEAFLYSNTLEEKEISYLFKRPTFFDWLFRRTRLAKFDFKAREILNNPPQMKNTTIFYDVNPKP